MNTGELTQIMLTRDAAGGWSYTTWLAGGVLFRSNRSLPNVFVCLSDIDHECYLRWGAIAWDLTSGSAASKPRPG
jgi:hypothetical protein